MNQSHGSKFLLLAWLRVNIVEIGGRGVNRSPEGFTAFCLFFFLRLLLVYRKVTT